MARAGPSVKIERQDDQKRETNVERSFGILEDGIESIPKLISQSIELGDGWFEENVLESDGACDSRRAPRQSRFARQVESKRLTCGHGENRVVECSSV